MEKPTYLLKSTPNALQHIFESVKNDVVIPKIVVYLPTENNPNLYQLVFGNLMPNGEIDTLSVSNNDDMRIVLTTVVKTLFSFFELNPDKVVIFTGSTLSRTRLYRAVISKFINETELFYEIKDITENGVLEKFQSNQTYLGYLSNLKMKNKTQQISNGNGHIITNDMPFVNLDSPHIKEQVQKVNEILKKIKTPFI